MYRIFDFYLESDIPLPELCRVKSEEVDKGARVLDFHLAEESRYQEDYEWKHHWRFSDGTVAISMARTGENYLLRFPGLADFLIRAVDHITCFPQDDVTEETVRHLLLDQVVPRVAAHSGNSILHASAVMVEGQAVVFVGDTGWGKSTLAAGFYARGSALISDDCLMLNYKDGYLSGIPNYTGARLLPDSVQNVLGGDLGMQEMAQYSAKRRLIVNDQQASFAAGIPIGVILVLSPPDISGGSFGVEIETMDGADRLVELIRHSFMLDLTDKDRVVDKMHSIGDILTPDHPLYRITYPRDHAILDTVYHRIIQLVTGQGYREVSTA